jgi:uncharacterized protein YjbI with pentapeptide repeats
MIYISLDEADAMNSNQFFKSGKYPLLDWILMIFYSYKGQIKESRIMNESFIVYNELIMKQYYTYLEYTTIKGNKIYSENLKDALDTLTYIRYIKQDSDEAIFEHSYNRPDSTLQITELGKEYIIKTYVDNNDTLISNIEEYVNRIKSLDDSNLIELIYKYNLEYLSHRTKLINLFFEKGNECLDINKNEEAISFYNKILQFDSNNIRAKEQKDKAFQKIKSRNAEINNRVLDLLRNGKIKEFNNIKKRDRTNLNLSDLDLRNLNLDDIDLSKIFLVGTKLTDASIKHADLSDANLERANLVDTKFDFANLSNANLDKANLTNTSLVATNFYRSNLSNSNLYHSIIVETDFYHANLSNANLSDANTQFIGKDIYKKYHLFFHADFSESNLSYVDLSGAKLSEAIIISLQSYDGLKLNNETDFSKAIIDDSDFIDYISNYTSKIPLKIKNKIELGKKLKNMEIGEQRINLLLQISKLPDQ